MSSISFSYEIDLAEKCYCSVEIREFEMPNKRIVVSCPLFCRGSRISLTRHEYGFKPGMPFYSKEQGVYN